MDGLELLLQNGENITFALLYITLYVYTTKKNDEREKKYQDTITSLTVALNGYEDIKDDVRYIRDKMTPPER